jgi:hypothetical protein
MEKTHLPDREKVVGVHFLGSAAEVPGSLCQYVATVRKGVYFALPYMW